MLVGDDGTAEVMTPEEALARAKEQETDLVEVAPKAKPPVVKITDFGRHIYQLQKKDRKQRSHQKQTEVKMLRFGFRTDKHDLDRLADRAKEFLSERHLVKFVVRMRGREMTNKDYAANKLMALVATLEDCSEIEQELKRQGSQFSMIIRPKKTVSPSKAEKPVPAAE